MKSEKDIKNQSDKNAAALKRAPFLVQMGIVAVGILIAWASASALNGFLNDMVKNEYDRMAQNTVEDIAQEFSVFENAMGSLVTFVDSREQNFTSSMRQQAESLIPDLNVFDHVLLVFKNEQGSWAIGHLYTKSENKGDQHFRFETKSALLKFIQQRNFFDQDGAQIVSGFPYEVVDPDALRPAFAIAQAVEKNNTQAGLVIGIINPFSVLDQSWIKVHQHIANIAVRELSSGDTLYRMQSEKQGELAGHENAYEFRMGGTKWEVRTGFNKQESATFIALLPAGVFTICVLNTLLCVLYVHGFFGHQKERKKLAYLLQKKSAALKAEEEKQAQLERTLGKTQSENDAIINAVSDIIFEADTDGYVVFLNSTWRKITGFDPEQSKGLELFTMLHPDDQERQRNDFQLLIKGEKSSYRSFTRLRTSSGGFRAVELAVSMIRQDRNNNLRVVGTFTDVEERRRAERALSEAEKKYRAIVENAAGGIFQMTPEGLYLSANPSMARILGYDGPSDVLRSVKNANKQVYANARERQSFLRELESKGSVNGHETQVYKKDGSTIWVNENIRAVRDDTGNTLYYEGSLEDITERKEVLLELHEAKVHSDMANRAKSEFLANMSHELRTPLNAIIGFSEIIRNEAFGEIQPKNYLEYAEDIHESGKGLMNIINEILDISKIEAGERQLSETVVDLDKVVQSCLELNANKIEANEMIIRIQMDEHKMVVAEERAIKQMVMNLLSNAIKFTPSGGRINITTELDKDGALRLSVTDTGIGLDEIDIKKALSPFGQVNNDLSRDHSGSGLGLTLVDALITLHGGKLELFSEKGIGTTATIVFPDNRVAAKKSKDPSAPKAKDSEHEDML